MPQTKKILFAEDDSDVLQMAVKYLGNYFDVTAASDGGEAWDSLEKEEFSCVVLDIEMPVLNGVEVLRNMRELEIETPVIIVTGRSRLEYAEKCADLRVEGYINKPYSVSTLKNRIDDLIKISHGRPASSKNSDKKLHPKVSEAVLYIKSKSHLNISVEDMAHALDISYEYLIRLFKKDIGVTPVEHINNIKVNNAIDFLINTSMPIHEVMEKAGFNTEQHFFSQFKKITGHTPREFRHSDISDSLQT